MDDKFLKLLELVRADAPKTHPYEVAENARNVVMTNVWGCSPVVSTVVFQRYNDAMRRVGYDENDKETVGEFDYIMALLRT